MEVINLNLIPNGTNPVVHVSQYDEGRDFRFNLFDGTSVLTLDGTETIECDVKKPDGNIVTVAVTNTSSDYVVVTTTLQMTACGGNSLGTIKISKGGVNLYTLNFVLYCERSPLENGIQSDSAIHNLESQVADIVSEQYDSANVIFDNVPTSGHGTPYTVNSDGLYNYIPKNVSDMDDVTITTPVQGEALVFDADGNLVNGTVSTVGNLDDLSDVDTTGKATGDSLRYDGAEWIAQPTTYQIDKADFDQINDFTPYANSHIVVPDEANLNPTASDIEYSGGVTVADALTSLTSLVNGLYQVQSNSSNPAIIDNVEAYASMLLIGFAQGIGGVMIALRVHNGSVTNVKDLLNLNAFSNANVTFSYDSQTKEFSIITTSASNSNFTVIVCNA